MTVFVYYEEMDNSYGVASPHIKIFSSLDQAEKAGLFRLNLVEVVLDTDKFVQVG